MRFQMSTIQDLLPLMFINQVIIDVLVDVVGFRLKVLGRHHI